MSIAKITLIGMYQYLDSQGDDLFFNMSLPSGIDKQTLIDSIMLKGAEFEPIYGDADFLKGAIGSWSAKWYRTLEKWANVAAMNYNPLDSFERYEEWSDDKAGTRKDKGSSSDLSVSTGKNTTETSKSAYDSGTYTPVDKDVTDSSNQSSGASVTDNEGQSSESAIHVGRSHGSEGSATPQSQLEAEWKAAMINLYDSAADLFLGELTIYVY